MSDASVDFTLQNLSIFSEEQNEFLERALEEKNPSLITIRQVHGNSIVVVSKDDSILPSRRGTVSRAPASKDRPAIPEADGLLTADERVALSIRTAKESFLVSC